MLGPVAWNSFSFLWIAIPFLSFRSLLTNYPVTKALSILSPCFVFVEALIDIRY